MIWQDIILTGAQIFFAVSLLPSILSKDKPAFATSASTSFMLYVIGIVNFTLQLYVATLWGTLAFQRYSQK